MCNATSSTFLTTQLNLLGWQCNSTGVYIGFLVLYFGLILGAHKLNTTIRQKHRDESYQSRKRKNLVT